MGGHDSESGNSGHCKTAGFAIQCSSDDDFWGSFDSGSSHIKAAGGEDVNGGSFGDWSAPCTTTSGFSLPANRNLKKFWAPNGERWAKFEMGPSVSAFEGKSVTCKLTVDNTLDTVTYNGESLSIDGPKGNWNADKTVTFTMVEDVGKLVVKGHDSESGNSGHCKTAGFAIQCSSSDDFWGSFDSGSSHIKAAGGEDVNGGSFGDWSAPCTSTSGFSLPANKNAKKLWAPNGERWAKFEMGPSV